jgi:hypothetical protein
MKMGKRRLKALDALGCRVLNKQDLVDEPRNRAERRAAARIGRRINRKLDKIETSHAAGERHD